MKSHAFARIGLTSVAAICLLLTQIRDELARLYNEQTEFYRNGARAKHTEAEFAEYDIRRQAIRGGATSP